MAEEERPKRKDSNDSGRWVSEGHSTYPDGLLGAKSAPRRLDCGRQSTAEAKERAEVVEWLEERRGKRRTIPDVDR